MAEHKSTPIPAELADNWELMVKVLKGRLAERRKELHKAMGKRPFKGATVTLDQQMISMGSLHQEDWAKIIQEQGRIKEDGRILFPNAIIKQAKKLHKQSQQGEINL